MAIQSALKIQNYVWHTVCEVFLLWWHETPSQTAFFSPTPTVFKHEEQSSCSVHHYCRLGLNWNVIIWSVCLGHVGISDIWCKCLFKIYKRWSTSQIALFISKCFIVVALTFFIILFTRHSTAFFFFFFLHLKKKTFITLIYLFTRDIISIKAWLP